VIFEPLVVNPDLDVHPDPLWPHVAVACGWQDARRARSRWPHAAVVGPLRTQRGIDLLWRSLLFNPQIRVLVFDGPDLTPGRTTVEALNRAWDDGIDGLPPVHHDVVLLVGVGPIDFNYANQRHPLRERVALPLPVPEVSPAPHGLPGDRVAGPTVADVWPRLLRQVLAAGARVPTQYGDSFELLSLVSVITDPAAAAEEALLDPAALEYFHRLISETPPEGAPYTYGSRLRRPVDQLGRVRAMLQANPGTRAAYATPWDPVQDSGLESGRPCLVGLWFRAVEGRLHAVVAFRSHDLFGAWPMNLRAICMLLGDLAREIGLAAGTVTCTSYSAHVYERDLAEAQAVAEAYRPRGIRWDQRSSWLVEAVDGGLRATALSPDGLRVLRVIEGRSGAQLRARIEETGLVQELGSALWLGSEIERVEREVVRGR
jgi:hypothetical protein